MYFIVMENLPLCRVTDMLKNNLFSFSGNSYFLKWSSTLNLNDYF